MSSDDSEELFVRKARPQKVTWDKEEKDDETSNGRKRGCGGIGDKTEYHRRRASSDTATQHASKRPKVSASEVVELVRLDADDNDGWLAPPPVASSSAAVALDGEAQAILERSRAAIANLNRAPSPTNQSEDDDDVVEILDDVGDKLGADQSLTLVLQLPDGQKIPFTCTALQPFSSILHDFLAQHPALEKSRLSQNPRVIFDGEVIGGHATPSDLDLQNNDLLDLR